MISVARRFPGHRRSGKSRGLGKVDAAAPLVHQMATQPQPAFDTTIRELAEHLPCLSVTASLAAVADLCLANDANDWLVLVDDAARPVRAVDRAALLQGKPFEHRLLAVNDETPIDVALDQVLASGCRLSRPVISCDAEGRYVGLVRVERMLALVDRA